MHKTDEKIFHDQYFRPYIVPKFGLVSHLFPSIFSSVLFFLLLFFLLIYFPRQKENQKTDVKRNLYVCQNDCIHRERYFRFPSIYCSILYLLSSSEVIIDFIDQLMITFPVYTDINFVIKLPSKWTRDCNQTNQLLNEIWSDEFSDLLCELHCHLKKEKVFIKDSNKIPQCNDQEQHLKNLLV